MIRVFGSDTCGKCQKIVNGLSLMSVPFEFVDAMADDTQELCDKHNVDQLPHVQLLSEDGSVQWEKAINVTLTEIVAKAKGQ